eukprot:3794380-Rhodomonas_salina.2
MDYCCSKPNPDAQRLKYPSTGYDYGQIGTSSAVHWRHHEHTFVRLLVQVPPCIPGYCDHMPVPGCFMSQGPAAA